MGSGWKCVNPALVNWYLLDRLASDESLEVKSLYECACQFDEVGWFREQTSARLVVLGRIRKTDKLRAEIQVIGWRIKSGYWVRLSRVRQWLHDVGSSRFGCVGVGGVGKGDGVS